MRERLSFKVLIIHRHFVLEFTASFSMKIHICKGRTLMFRNASYIRFAFCFVSINKEDKASWNDVNYMI